MTGKFPRYLALLSVLAAAIVSVEILRASFAPTCLARDSTQADADVKRSLRPRSPPTGPESLTGNSTQHPDNQPDRHPDKHYLLAVVIIAAPNQTERRIGIRKTWLGGVESLNPPVIARFFIGAKGLQPGTRSLLLHERDEYRDMIFLPDFFESYENLTSKVLSAVVWAYDNWNFSYLLKCDDDSYVRLKDITRELSERAKSAAAASTALYWGFFLGDAKVTATGKWKESEWFLCDLYLPYAAGGGYIISQDLVRNVALTSASLQLYHNEDTAMGAWLAPYKAERKHDVRFNTNAPSRGCNNHYLISHKVTLTEMYLKHLNLRMTGKQCKREFIEYASYEYNWLVPPSQCCEWGSVYQ